MINKNKTKNYLVNFMLELFGTNSSSLLVHNGTGRMFTGFLHSDAKS